MEKVEKKCSLCKGSFTCDGSCGMPERSCFCPKCFLSTWEQREKEDRPVTCATPKKRLKCSLLTQKQKMKWLIWLITNKVEVMQE